MVIWRTYGWIYGGRIDGDIWMVKWMFRWRTFGLIEEWINGEL